MTAVASNMTVRCPFCGYDNKPPATTEADTGLIFGCWSCDRHWQITPITVPIAADPRLTQAQ